MTKHDLLNSIDNIKQKLTDKEYKELVEKLSAINLPEETIRVRFCLKIQYPDFNIDKEINYDTDHDEEQIDNYMNLSIEKNYIHSTLNISKKIYDKYYRLSNKNILLDIPEIQLLYSSIHQIYRDIKQLNIKSCCESCCGRNYYTIAPKISIKSIELA